MLVWASSSLRILVIIRTNPLLLVAIWLMLAIYTYIFLIYHLYFIWFLHLSVPHMVAVPKCIYIFYLFSELIDSPMPLYLLLI